MRTPSSRRAPGPAARVLPATAVLTLLLTSAASAQAGKQPASAGALTPELEQARAALDKYQDPIAAVHDGYFSTVGCVEYTRGGDEGSMHYAPGGMGVHFLNLQLIGQKLDPAKPQILIYEPVGGKLRLAAAEWFVPVAATGGTHPAIFGRQLQGPMEGHHPLQPAELHHYDLHVWLWKSNPAGVFSPTNPAVKCPKGSYSFSEKAPKMVDATAH
jgi:hypothetical protein